MYQQTTLKKTVSGHVEVCSRYDGMKKMSASPSQSKRRFNRPVLAAAVGLGDITLQRTQATPGRSIRAGGHVRCDLPYPSRTPVTARRRGEAWIIGVPQGTAVRGADVNDGRVVLHDWDTGIEIREGQAWLKLWPTRAEAFRDGSALVRSAGFVARSLPLLWIALVLTVGVGSVGLWASTSFRGNPAVFALGDGGGGLHPDRVASFGDGDYATGSLAPWSSLPDPVVSEDEPAEGEPDATDDALAEEDEADEPEPSVTPEPAEAAEQAPESSEQETNASDDAVAENVAVEGGVPGGVEGGAEDARAAGGGGSFGLGGGTDDGFSDRSESVEALEQRLVACMSGERTHRLNLAVDTAGRAKPLSYKGVWTDSERSCAARAVEEWAFPAAQEVYEVSLRVRKSGSRLGSRA
jgi:hypothetical protein